MKLQGKVAVVSGGASGIGEGICRRFAQEGASVIVADIDGAKAEAVAQEIASNGGESMSFAVDVCLYDQVLTLVESTERRFGRLDVLVTAAGISKVKPIEQLSIDWWQAVINVNLNGLFYCCHAAAGVMMRQKSGKIVNIGSLAGLIAIPNNSPYVASKHGVVGLTKALAIDLGSYNINVNCIAPGFILSSRAVAQGRNTEETRSRLLADIPLGRLGMPEDCARVVEFLTTDLSDYVTGQCIPICGGYVAF